jgi:ankyrin repeat protein
MTSINLMRSIIARGDDVNVQGREGRTALHWAAIVGSAEKMNILLDAGADATLVDDHGFTAAQYFDHNDHLFMLIRLEKAARRRLEEAARRDLATREKTERREKARLARLNLKAKCNGRTAMHYACIDGDLDTLKALVDEGADIDALDDHGFTPLQYLEAYTNRLERLEFTWKIAELC